jgi:hypothetical protein
MAQSAYYPGVLVEYLNLFHGCEGTKKSHSIQMKWEYILVNKNENAVNAMLKQCIDVIVLIYHNISSTQH